MVQPQYDRPAADGPGMSPDTGGAQVVVASYSRYADAERAVDYLSDQGFPVERVAIVGRGLTSVEQVTGRLTIWRAAGQSAVSGAILGALLGWLFGLFDWVNPLISSLLLALYGALIGAVLGAVFGMIGHALTRGRRDFSSIAGMRAETYEVLVDPRVADQAVRLLEAPGAPGSGPPARHAR